MIEKYSAVHIANYFIEKADQESIDDLTPMKIQKLVYMSQGWALAMLDTDIIGGEDIEAWQHGPVIPSLYHSLKHYKNLPVNQLIEENYNMDDEDNFSSSPAIPVIIHGDKDVLKLLDAIWENYKYFSPAQLRELTHRHNTPWSMYYKNGEQHIVIAKESIKAFYEILREKVKTND